MEADIRIHSPIFKQMVNHSSNMLLKEKKHQLNFPHNSFTVENIHKVELHANLLNHSGEV